MSTISSPPVRSAFTRQNPALALGAFIIAPARYLDMAAAHDTAVTLASSDLQSRFDRGELGAAWQRQIREQAEAYATSLTTSVRKSLNGSVLIMFLVLALAVGFGLVRPGLQFSLAKFVTVVGAFIGLWGGLLQAYPPVQTNKGEALHELVHARLSKTLFVLAAIGIFASLM
jgi:hypothetical protein